MKKIISLFLAASAFACTQEKSVDITVTNPSSIARSNEITEISMDAVAKLNGESFIISDNNGTQIPYQITYDNKIIFPVDVNANSNVTYQIKPGTPDKPAIVACGKFYPERVDDIAWENDRIAFRTYGPALQATGEQAFGYDIWVKCVSEPVVDMRYKTELNPESRAKIAELQKTDKKAAQELANSISYHIDHGNGLDYYKVGPTLGAGTSALLANDSIVYPYCYKEYEILDNGPLRFTVKLVYNPLTVKGNDNVIETRILSLDAGSQMNKIALSFANLNEPTPLVTGIVLHEPSTDYQADATNGYIAYADPEDATNGQIFVGAVFPEKLSEAKAVNFSDTEKKQRGADGHVLAYTTYAPGSEYTYYTGAGWSKWGFRNSAEWFKYVQEFAQKVKQPLQVTVQ
ncbi:DUF4861 domain-containing protein [uncultured Parabacteroides sp.]|jgi:hypothetical protein|uniref:DUF4861 domain-containing protein n=1 Tax=uncultured Parabacteroides sp. TaxID=512312 RepID=UPI0025ED711A|nr:DUF4861 domain-containing protein [uncultured Parabacteroides sp.]